MVMNEAPSDSVKGGLGGFSSMLNHEDQSPLNLLRIYTSKMTSYGKSWTKALDVLAEIEGEPLQSNLIIYNACINACTKAAEWQQSVRFVANLKDGKRWAM